MTTAYSPLFVLQSQADNAAKHTKNAERGIYPPGHAAKLAEARKKETFTIAVVMDDKIVKIEMKWTEIAKTSEAALSALILREMRKPPEEPPGFLN